MPMDFQVKFSVEAASGRGKRPRNLGIRGHVVKVLAIGLRVQGLDFGGLQYRSWSLGLGRYPYKTHKIPRFVPPELGLGSVSDWI